MPKSLSIEQNSVPCAAFLDKLRRCRPFSCNVVVCASRSYATPDEAKAMLNKAVAAVKEDEAKALDMFNNGSGGFKDRDLYVLCANASDGIITAHPTQKGGQLKNFPRGEEVMRTATENRVSEITYPWPRPGSVKPFQKHTFYRKVGDQICGVGYYSE